MGLSLWLDRFGHELSEDSVNHVRSMFATMPCDDPMLASPPRVNRVTHRGSRGLDQPPQQDLCTNLCLDVLRS